MITVLFRDREGAEKLYSFLIQRGYISDELNLLFVDETRNSWFSDDDTELGNEVLEGASANSATGGTLNAIIGGTASIGTNVLIPGLGLVVAGPLAAALSGAGAGGLTGGLVGALIGSGIPEERAQEYETGLREGGIVLAFEPRTSEDRDYLEQQIRNAKGEYIYDDYTSDLRSDNSYSSKKDKAAVSSTKRSVDVGVKDENDLSGEYKSETPSVDKVTCYFHAEIQEEIIVKRVATVEVRVSRELIEPIFENSVKTAKTDVDPQKKLVIQVIPKANFELLGENRVEIDPPQLEKPETLYFDLRATNTGEGEIWIVARQGQLPLITLTLKTKILAKKALTSKTKKAITSGSALEAPILTEPLHQLSIYEIEPSSFMFDMDSPPLDIRETFTIKTNQIDRRQYIENIYKEIEKRWLSHESDVEAFTAELRAYGGQLFNDLFPRELQEILWQNRNKIKSIQVISTEPFIPWELVHLKDPGKPYLPDEVRFLGQMGLIRWLHGGGTPPNRLKLRKGRVRYVIPHYPVPQYELPEAELEYKFLEDKFDAEFVSPHPNEVRELINTPGAFDLLHFACHGYAELDNISNAHLMLEGRIEDNKYVPELLSATLAGEYSNLQSDDNRPMIVLNACQTGRAGYHLTGIGGFAEAFLTGRAGAFVGTLWAVGDSPARTFTETFYSEMIDKNSKLAEAVVEARDRARLAGDATWLAYAVYGHPHMKIDSF